MQVGGAGSAINLDPYDYSGRREPHTDRSETSVEQSHQPQKRDDLSEEEQQQIRELKQRDQEVRTHENAHKSAGGQHVRGGARYEYGLGPDGQRYVTGGEVSIDVSKENSPQQTVAKAQAISAAALAPADPSSADRAIAAKANAMLSQARMEIAETSRRDLEEARTDLERAEESAQQVEDTNPQETAPVETQATSADSAYSFEAIVSSSKVAAAKRAYTQEATNKESTLSQVA